jgi:hypothetical protein
MMMTCLKILKKKKKKLAAFGPSPTKSFSNEAHPNSPPNKPTLTLLQ